MTFNNGPWTKEPRIDVTGSKVSERSKLKRPKYEMVSDHECSHMDGCDILFYKSSADSYWLLEMMEDCAKIKFCPFCGIDLGGVECH